MIRRLICYIFDHQTFELPSGAVVCKRCWKWWAV